MRGGVAFGILTSAPPSCHRRAARTRADFLNELSRVTGADGHTVGLSARVRRALRAGRPGREQRPWNQQVALSRRTAYTGPVTTEDACVVTGRER